MKRVALILAVLVGLAVSAAPAMAYYPRHYCRPGYPAAGYRVGYGGYAGNFYPSYGTSLSVGFGVPSVGFGYSNYPAYGYGYPAYGVRYGYPAATFASPASFGFGPAAVFGY